MSNFLYYHDHKGVNSNSIFKSTLFQGSQLLVGLNCLEPGQIQNTHVHSEQDKFYFVLEGKGQFVVGKETRQASAGCTVWAAAGVPHGVTNDTQLPLILLVGIAPPPT